MIEEQQPDEIPNKNYNLQYRRRRDGLLQDISTQCHVDQFCEAHVALIKAST